MKKQLMMALSCLPFLCALMMAPISAATPAQQPTSSELQEVIAEKLAREQADREEYENSEGEISEEDVDSLANKAWFWDGWFSGEESYTTTHTGAWHFATGVSGTGNHVFLEEGSGWMIAPSDAHKTLNWMGEDVILVIPAPWYSFYGYILVNHNTGVKVYADLKEKPSEFNIYTLFISKINGSEGTLTLSDKTVWSFGGFFDNNVAINWRVGQKVLIGINTSWWTASKKPNLLISVEPGVNGMIRARCMY